MPIYVQKEGVNCPASANLGFSTAQPPCAWHFVPTCAHLSLSHLFLFFASAKTYLQMDCIYPLKQ